MSSIRLPKSYVTRLRQSAGAYVINAAIERYDAGELVIQEPIEKPKCKEVLQVYSTRNKRAIQLYSDGKIQAVLKAHWDNPRDYSKQIALLDQQINALWAMQPQTEYIINDNRED